MFLYWKIIAVFFENISEHINTLPADGRVLLLFQQVVYVIMAVL